MPSQTRSKANSQQNNEQESPASTPDSRRASSSSSPLPPSPIIPKKTRAITNHPDSPTARHGTGTEEEEQDESSPVFDKVCFPPRLQAVALKSLLLDASYKIINLVI
mmetsp:Transcript_20194/g.29203  ORF Transcript_20194/g.29203 Transcript_20194/m.29203 type:complete len:107 (+) Transcript_20194:557-877(+)